MGMEIITEQSNILKIAKGIVISFVVTLVLLFLFSLLLVFTEISENTIPVVVIISTVISILIGSSITNLKIKKNGIINGGVVGGIYILLLYLLSSALSGDFTLGINSIIMIISGVIAGMLGGIIGVNLKGK